MSRLSKHFDRSEFECGCGCGFATADYELIEVLENLRETYMAPITINSGCRCEKHNKAVGGEDGSKHMQGIAADIVVQGYSPAKIFQYLDQKYAGRFGVGEYKQWVHIDVRPTKARWRKV